MAGVTRVTQSRPCASQSTLTFCSADSLCSVDAANTLPKYACVDYHQPFFTYCKACLFLISLFLFFFAILFVGRCCRLLQRATHPHPLVCACVCVCVCVHCRHQSNDMTTHDTTAARVCVRACVRVRVCVCCGNVTWTRVQS